MLFRGASIPMLGVVGSVVLSMASVALADNNHAAAYSRIGVGARALGMGGAYVAVADDPTATVWNPSRLMGVDNLAFTYMPRIDMELDRSYLFFGCAKSWRYVSVGLGYTRARWDGFESRSGIGASGGDFSIIDDLFLPSVALHFGTFGIGFTLPKIFQQEIDKESKSGIGFDAGASLGLGRWVELGIAVQDVYSKIDDDKVPYNLRAGVCVNPVGQLLLATDLEKTEDDETVYHTGAEIGIPYPPGLRWALRFGFSDIGRDNQDTSFSLGGSLRVERFYSLGLDITYIDEEKDLFSSPQGVVLSVNLGK